MAQRRPDPRREEHGRGSRERHRRGTRLRLRPDDEKGGLLGQAREGRAGPQRQAQSAEGGVRLPEPVPRRGRPSGPQEGGKAQRELGEEQDRGEEAKQSVH